MESAKRYGATVRMPEGLTGVRGLITVLAGDNPTLEVKKEEGKAFLRGQEHTVSFGNFTPLAGDGLRVRGEITVSAGNRERIPIKGEFDFKGQGWIERDQGRDPPER